MSELQSFGMKIKPFVRTAVKRVSDDWIVKAFGMGGVDTQLMRPSRFRIKMDTSVPVLLSDHLVTGDGLFAKCRMDNLPRAVVWIQAERKLDYSFCRYGRPFQKGDVAFLDLPSFELRLQLLMDPLVLGDQQEPRGGHIEPMDQQWAVSFRIVFMGLFVDGV